MGVFGVCAPVLMSLVGPRGVEDWFLVASGSSRLASSDDTAPPKDVACNKPILLLEHRRGDVPVGSTVHSLHSEVVCGSRCMFRVLSVLTRTGPVRVHRFGISFCSCTSVRPYTDWRVHCGPLPFPDRSKVKCTHVGFDVCRGISMGVQVSGVREKKTQCKVLFSCGVCPKTP